MIRKLGKVVLPIVAILTIAVIVGQAQSVKTHHVRDEVRNGQAQAMGRLPLNQVLQLDLVLQIRDQAGLDSFLKDLYDPTSPSYRQFLTPQEFTARFGPTQESYDTVVRFAKTYGFQVVGGSRDAMDVQVKGTVAVVEAAFHVNMRTFKHPTENRIFFSPDGEPTLDLPFNLWHISGLDNYSIPKPLVVNKDDFAKAHGIAPEAVVSHATTGSGPSASFLGTDMRAAYYGSGPLTGAGQNLGLLEYYGTNLADLKTYYTNVGQTDLSGVVKLLSTDGTSTSCSYPVCDDTEQTLDMTQALGMAPGLSSLVVYVGSADTAMISAMTAPPAGYPLPATIGCSWGWTPVDSSTLNPYFQKMAAQGQNFFVASGDSSTWTTGNYPWPAEDAYVVTVGGTDLVTLSGGGAWSSETAWVDSGGGISPHLIAIPSWQKLAGIINSSNHGSTTYRNGPDVSANANFTFYVCADQTTCTANSYGGTSFAAPMWAGYIALVNQQLVQNSQSAIGFLNPTIYVQNVSGGALSAAYPTNFHDITSGTSGSYSAVKGYDLVTGWGSPNAGLLAALTGAVPTSGFSLSGTPLSIVQGTSGTSTVTSTPFGGYSSSITLSASGLPSGVTVGFSTNPIGPSGNSVLTFTAAATAATGTFTVTVTGKGSDSNTTVAITTITLTVTAASSNFTISANPTSLSISRSSSGSSKITTALAQGNISSISLSASGQGSGTSISFSPSSISGGNGSSTMNVSVSRRASTGTFNIVVKGTGGGNSHTATVQLTVH
jgi:kumamolisin